MLCLPKECYYQDGLKHKRIKSILKQKNGNKKNRWALITSASSEFFNRLVKISKICDYQNLCANISAN